MHSKTRPILTQAWLNMGAGKGVTTSLQNQDSSSLKNITLQGMLPGYEADTLQLEVGLSKTRGALG